MAYCTIADLVSSITEKTVIQLSDDVGAGEINEPVVNEAINKAADEMNSLLSVRYPNLQLASVPQLASANAELAIYRLFNRRQLGHTDDAKNRRKQAIDWLTKVSQRKANIIGILDQTGTDDHDGSVIALKGQSRNFNWDQY